MERRTDLNSTERRAPEIILIQLFINEEEEDKNNMDRKSITDSLLLAGRERKAQATSFNCPRS